MLQRILNRTCYTNKEYTPLPGRYSKPVGFVSGQFTNRNKESKCWAGNNPPKIPSKHQKKYTLEISGFLVGRFQDYSIHETSITIKSFMEDDLQKQLKNWDSPKSIAVYSLSPNGTTSHCIEFFHATLQKRWLSEMTISYTKKKARSLY